MTALRWLSGAGRAIRDRLRLRRRRPVLRWSFLLVLLLAPLPLGSNRPLPWTVLALALGLLLLAWSAAAARSTRDVLPPGRVWPALAGLALVAGVALLQIAPFTPRAWHHPLWLEAAAVLGDEVSGRISLDPHETGTALMRLLTYGAAFWLALQLGRESHGARPIVQTIAAAGLAYAAYGLLVHLLDLKTVLWRSEWYMPGLASSFVNPNTFATYAGLGLLCTLGLLITTVYRDLRSRRLRRLPWAARVRKVTWRGWWLVAAVVALAFALILTRSRAGVTSTAVAVAVLLASFGATRLMKQRDVMVSCGVTLALALAVFALGGDDLAGRLEQRGLESPRWEVYPQIVGAIGDAPWLGTGYGTFPEAFRSYQPSVSGTYWNHAHNTYLENALELGVLPAAALTLAIGWLAWACAQSLRRRRSNALYPCIGLAATTLVGLHSLLDFSLEIPAVAVTYAAIMGIACGRAHGSPLAGRRRELAAWRSPRQRRGLALGVALAAMILMLATPRLVAELAGLPARVTEGQLEAAVIPGTGRLDRAIAAGQSAAAWADAGQHWSRVAHAEMALAAAPGLLPNARHSRLERADQALRRALAAAPANPAAWAQLAYVTLARGGAPAAVSGALTLSVLTGPNDGGLLASRSALAALAWDQLDPRARSLFTSQFAKTMAFAPQRFVDAIRRTAGVEVVRAQLEDQPRLQRELEHLLLIFGRR